jgi:hypothetical protein
MREIPKEIWGISARIIGNPERSVLPAEPVLLARMFRENRPKK